ncbi:unnamed protein product [Rangifer tarandus platyrhynchus]|uniref:Uncharacterized protein n=2 Tax=Rangifer tarandus platyrhynchus TaxID=3082113 RepID=A0AC59Y406_RANTA|nr:unnamed protein product [Rangifer tarandus platyrhynchus]
MPLGSRLTLLCAYGGLGVQQFLSQTLSRGSGSLTREEVVTGWTCVSLILYPHQPSTFLAGSSQSVIKSVIGDTRYVHATSLQFCLILCDPMACSLPGSSVHEILQARILEWVAISSSRGSSRPRDQTKSPAAAALHSDSLALNHQGSPLRN